MDILFFIISLFSLPTEVLHKIDRLFELEENEDVKLKLGAISSLVFDVRREYMVLFEEMERDVKI